VNPSFRTTNSTALKELDKFKQSQTDTRTTMREPILPSPDDIDGRQVPFRAIVHVAACLQRWMTAEQANGDLLLDKTLQ
jgi:hypothetical protein